MSHILFLCPTHRDRREIAALGLDRHHRFFFHDYASLLLEELVADEPPADIGLADVSVEIDRLIEQYHDARIEAVVSSDDYPGSSLASILAQRWELAGVAPDVNLRCQHKYYSRLEQQRAVPESVPGFRLLNEAHIPDMDMLRYPVFLKPVKSFFSVGAHPADSPEELRAAGRRSSLLDTFFQPFESLLREYAGLDLGSRVIVEDLLEGEQVTVEGYVYRGVVHIIGVVDSIMYPGTRSFQRFEYPSALPSDVQARMRTIATRVMAHIGFDNGLFNVEMMYSPRTETIHIIEINPRMASQFADLYEKVDGTNTYHVLVDLALGREPIFCRREGKHRFAASCVLRRFENAFVRALPSSQEIASIESRYPDIRVEVLATQGRRLSQEMQDGQSYRYGILSIGGRDRADVLEILERCRSRLTFEFERTYEERREPRVIRTGT